MKIPFTDTHVYLGNPDRKFNLNAEQKAEGPSRVIPGVLYAGRKSYAGTPLKKWASAIGIQLSTRRNSKIELINA